MKRTVFASLIVAALSANVGLAQAPEKTGGAKEGYLGLAVEAVPPFLASQLPDVLSKGQGVLIGQVAKDSPAAKAGLERYDILLSFGDQKIYSPEQLVKLVRADHPGQVVPVGFLHGGKAMTGKVTLGEAPPAPPRHGHAFRLLPDEHAQKTLGSNPMRDETVWESFDAMKLTRQDSKHWRAEIEYRNKEGKKDTKVFSGTREEIRKDLLHEKDLPVEERNHLLRALNMHDPIFQFYFPSWGSMPSEFLEQP